MKTKNCLQESREAARPILLFKELMLLERMHTKPGTAASRAPSAHPGQWNAKSERKARGKREGGTHGRGAIPCYGIGMELLVNSLLTSDGAAFGDGDSLMAVGGLSFIGLSDLEKSENDTDLKLVKCRKYFGGLTLRWTKIEGTLKTHEHSTIRKIKEIKNTYGENLVQTAHPEVQALQNASRCC